MRPRTHLATSSAWTSSRLPRAPAYGSVLEGDHQVERDIVVEVDGGFVRFDGHGFCLGPLYREEAPALEEAPPREHEGLRAEAFRGAVDQHGDGDQHDAVDVMCRPPAEMPQTVGMFL